MTAEATVADAGVADADVGDAGVAGAGVADAGVGDAGVAGAGVADVDVFIFDAVVEVEATTGCFGVSCAVLETDVRTLALRAVTGGRAAPAG